MRSRARVLASSQSMTASARFPVGTQVILTGDHPWAGEAGEIVGYEVLGMFPHEPARPRVRMQNGEECFATAPERHLRRL